MAELHRSGFSKLLASCGRTLRPKSAVLLLVMGLSLMAVIAPVFAQSAPSPQSKKAPQAANQAPAEPAGPPPAQIWLPPLQAAQHAPVIVWDGQLLTIDAENSSLSDVLLAIRSRTGASIEMPASTNRERIATHLGPAPVREVISSLLYGTDFNYVIQSVEGDEAALGKVIITARDGEQSDELAAGDTRSNSSNPKMRLMPGYAAPGKRDFEVSLSNATDDSSSNVAETPAAEPSGSAQDQPATAAADSSAPVSQNDTKAATASADATDSSSSSDSPTLTAAEPISAGPAGTIAGNTSSESSGDSGSPSISQMEQKLQHMYQQRQQLQAQQNRPAPTPAP
ncbi:MAG: hypothetical protein C5B58_13150 [Acidobacteria bacterium]|nr:MAG: hypothetical protein C5B58_13150 [Acidobacteriota bacterium]